MPVGDSDKSAAPFFSIGITTYDRIDLLVETLQSVLNQTFEDFEVIVANDNPQRSVTGETLGLTDARIRFVNNQTNLGELANMNSLLEMSRGRYCTWVADDDLYAPTFLEAAYRALKDFNFPRCVYTSFGIGSTIPNLEPHPPSRVYSGRDFLSGYLAGTVKAIGTMGFFARDYLAASGGLEDLAGGRIALYTEYLHLIKTGLLKEVAYVDAPLIIYRAHTGSWGCTTEDLELLKLAGLNLADRSIDIFQSPAVVEDFKSNLTNFLRRFMSEFLTKAERNENFGDRARLAYLAFSRKYLRALRGTARYRTGLRCLAKVQKELLRKFVREKIVASPVTNRTADLSRKLKSAINLKMLDRPTRRETELILELRSSLNQASSRPASNDWARTVERIRQRVLNEDPRSFLRWGILSTLFAGGAPFIQEELSYLQRHPEWSHRWREAILESAVGNPPRYPLYPESSSNLIHQAYQVAQFEDITKQRISDFNFIFEFGGGYGSMCRLAHQLGFSGTYLIYDLEELSCLQAYYLKSLGLEVSPADVEIDWQGKVLTTSDKELIPKIISKMAENDSPSGVLFLDTWPVTKAPLPFDRTVEDVAMLCNAFLIVYEDAFGHADNLEFFATLKGKKRDITWHDQEALHLPGSRFLIGQGEVSLGAANLKHAGFKHKQDLRWA
jgi:glycosyltransferase involved in cell wall biosynthesis